MKQLSGGLAETTARPRGRTRTTATGISLTEGEFAAHSGDPPALCALLEGKIEAYTPRVSPELRHLRCFVTVAEELSFTRAAQRLHIAQPALSTTVRQLEDELGVKLLERTTRKVALTGAGELVLERARATIEAADNTFALGRDAGRGLVGRVRIGLSPVARQSVVAALADACSQAHPGIAVHTREEPTAGLLAALVAHELDLAVAWCPIARPGLRLEPLRDEPVVAYVEEGHALASRNSIALTDLGGARVIVGSGSQSDGYSRALLDLLAQEGVTVEPVPDPYPDAGLLAAAEGHGIAVGAPSGARAELRGLRCLPVTPRRTLPFSLAWREEDSSAALAVTLEAARGLRDGDGWLAGPIANGDK